MQIRGDAYSFKICREEEFFKVRIPHSSSALTKTQILNHEAYYFKDENFYLIPEEKTFISNFAPSESLKAEILSKNCSFAWAALSETKNELHFRYFTSFNAKFEDQATGSIFRYIKALQPSEGLEYKCSQLSATGARMSFQVDGAQVAYWGAVRRLT